MKQFFPVLLLALSLAGCGERPAPVTPAQTSAPSAAQGRSLYIQVCAQCHGMDARGHKFLGADLKTSVFFNQSPEDEVVAMIVAGKPATADRPAMPPKGGRLSLTEQDIRDIIAYIHSLPGPASPDSSGTTPP